MSHLQQILVCQKSKIDRSDLREAPVVAYESGDCSNPNQKSNIVGFATALITKIDRDNDIIEATLKCDGYKDARGGGGYGTFGTILGLVE